VNQVAKATKWIIFAMFIVLIIWDVIAYLVTDNATISVTLTDWGYSSPWMPFVFGVLMGHFWFPARGSKD